MRRWIAGLLMLVLVANCHAVSCYFTVAKEDCWKDYDVKISIWDNKIEKQLVILHLPKGELWKRVRFECHPKQSFRYTASYSPEIWKGQANKVYHGKKTMALPLEVKPGEAAWHLRLCYSDAFNGVTLPPGASKACQCDWSKIPEVKHTPE
jgi:hypothetical protein